MSATEGGVRVNLSPLPREVLVAPPAPPPGPPETPRGGPADGTAAVPPLSPARGEQGLAPAPAAKLSTRDFSLFYGATRALKGVTLEIAEHSVTAIIGPSGCGKSTLLRAFNRMNDLIPGVRTEGEVRIGGTDVRAPATDVVDLRRRVGMVFQRPNPFPKSIFENLAFGLRLVGLRDRSELEARVEKSLRRAALWEEVKDRLDRSALQLSGGQQQRLCIARCLAVEPEVILMDEPASALDPTATARIEELVLQLKSTYTILVVTHNMQQAARVADTTAFMLDGELIEHGETEKIFTKPDDSRTEDYVTGKFG